MPPWVLMSAPLAPLIHLSRTHATGPGYFVQRTPGNQETESGRLCHSCKQRCRADQFRLFVPCRRSKKPSSWPRSHSSTTYSSTATYDESAVKESFKTPRRGRHFQPSPLCRCGSSSSPPNSTRTPGRSRFRRRVRYVVNWKQNLVGRTTNILRSMCRRHCPTARDPPFS